MQNFKEQIEERLNRFLSEREDLFLINLKVSPSYDVVVTLDGDRGVSIQDCLDASRAIEFNMDRELQDFSLQVMSAGLSEALTMSRQYHKNIGRELLVILNNQTELSGLLKETDEMGIVLELKYRKAKEIGKGKQNVVEDRKLNYTEIQKSTVVLKF